MVSLSDLKQYLGYGAVKVDATPATGILRIQRKQGVTGAIPIPSNLWFYVGSKSYRQPPNPQPPNPTEVATDQLFADIQVISTTPGADQNLVSGQTWTTNQRIPTPRPGLFLLTEQATISNFGITGGTDEIPALPDRIRPRGILEDPILERILEVSKDQIAFNACGYTAEETFEWDNRCDQAVLLLCVWHIEQDTTTAEIDMTEVTAPQTTLSPKTKVFPRPKLYSAIWNRVIGLVSHKRQVSRFMPDTNGVSSG